MTSCHSAKSFLYFYSLWPPFVLSVFKRNAHLRLPLDDQLIWSKYYNKFIIMKKSIKIAFFFIAFLFTSIRKDSSIYVKTICRICENHRIVSYIKSLNFLCRKTITVDIVNSIEYEKDRHFYVQIGIPKKDSTERMHIYCIYYSIIFV